MSANSDAQPLVNTCNATQSFFTMSCENLLRNTESRMPHYDSPCCCLQTGALAALSILPSNDQQFSCRLTYELQANDH